MLGVNLHKGKILVGIGEHSYDKEKVTAYECGLESLETNLGIETRERFYLKFYLIGIYPTLPY